MTKKSYIAVARIVAKVNDNLDRWRLTSEFCLLFESLNPAFDTEKFRSACNPKRGDQ
jgi:hypothetical protein